MPANAAIYIADPSILGSRTLDAIGEVHSYEGLSHDQQASGMQLRLAWGTVVVNFMPSEQLPDHLAGLRSYAEQVIGDENTLVYALARISHVRMCLGCDIEHQPDSESAAQQFLFRLNSELNGLLFLYDSIFDRDGQPIGGPATVE
jgi:hypothetical protein